MSSTTSNASSCAVVELTEEEGRKFFDEVTRAELGMSGDEFLRRYDAGDLLPKSDIQRNGRGRSQVGNGL
ncbi:hypothetical protein TBS_05010 [Thermobispora bispora]|jgi:hypothetical protein|uniref:Uncharacterized protein n=1 Tax=Thermobispora bispora (strain ATCC 19993 / DSM 43833 / CBS 139.67 / JCM 10125 / KCTC 9307 / NBRC 14880 / R51) TaxID=469371 RepID=D6YA92_THEBD|nr:hypothetical protein [Thermobispora bispora]ADG88235.1 hypothetical protein Tbis_1518 [Thermobispora bispora DSM 43833]MBO2474127.1 hypothetical protein [Actinomycetales bacterium]MBX6169440.1 hypothetical protein [Thermobispora bispora]MDI9579554.1 hypothetical protein [Thermobispora sp.]